MKTTFYTLILTLVTTAIFGQVVIKDADLGDGEYFWTADNEYLLDGYVFLESGGKLNIEAGTVIKAASTPSTGDVSTALIIAKGAQIFAEGTAEAPIIFTVEFDEGDLTDAEKGLWGGLIILGDAVAGINGVSQNIEGIPSTEGRAEYGGMNNEDNSGILRYVSIRHGGSKLEANNEINGLTLGAVGTGTVIDYVEVFANLDDGIELFGGTVDVKHAVVSFCGDDSYDFDQSWGGRGQFWFTIQNQLSNRAGEFDGSESADLNPKTSPVLSNLTFIGAGSSSTNEDGNNAFAIRDDGAVQIYNSIITAFADRAIKLDNDADGSSLLSDSYDRFLAGELTFSSTVFFDFGAGSDFASIVDTDGGDNPLLVSHLEENGSVFSDPAIAGISREADGGLDPRINGNSAAYGITTTLEDDFFTETNYAGAFGTENWAEGWTALSQRGYFGDLLSSVKDPLGFKGENSLTVFPNPSQNNTLTLTLDLAETKKMAINITDLNGRIVKSISSSQTYTPGKYQISLQNIDLPNGMYTVNLIADQGIYTNKFIVNQY